SDPHSDSTVAATFTPTSPTLGTECEKTHDPRPVHFRTRAAARRGRGGRPGRPTRPGQGGLRRQVRGPLHRGEDRAGRRGRVDPPGGPGRGVRPGPQQGAAPWHRRSTRREGGIVRRYP